MFMFIGIFMFMSNTCIKRKEIEKVLLAHAAETEAPEKRMSSRLVPESKRQRTRAACDNCKQRKIRCLPAEGAASNSAACLRCLRTGVECATTLPRRRRVHGSLESLSQHHRMLIILFQALFPETDAADMGALVRLGQQLGLPVRITASGELDTGGLEAGVPGQRAFSPRIENSSSSKNIASANDASDPDDVDVDVKNTGTVVYDQRGGSHYIGSTGTPALFRILCNLLLKRTSKTSLSFDNQLKLFQKEMDYTPSKFVFQQILKEPYYPISKLISREESDLFINEFFKSIHPFYFIFDERLFRSKYEVYWKIIQSSTPKNDIIKLKESVNLSDSNVTCIYLIWLMMSKTMGIPLSNQIIIKITGVLKLILTDVTFASNLSNIQFLYLFSIYLHSVKNRDTSWNLIGFAIRQSISLGLHRKIIKSSKFTYLSNQIFWSLYQTDLTLCSNFGRPSTISEEEIDIDYPNLSNYDSIDESFKIFYINSIKLSRMLAKILKTRTYNQDPISLINIETTLSMKSQLIQIFKKLDIKDLTSIENIYDFKLSMTFHSYVLKLTLPFMLYISTKNYQISKDETLLSIIQMSLNSAISISKLCEIAIEKNFNFISITDNDSMFIYCATLNLSLFLIYLSNGSNDTNELKTKNIITDEPEEVLDKKKILKFISNMVALVKRCCHFDGTTKRILDILEGLINDLNYVKVQDNLSFEDLDLETYGAGTKFLDSFFMNDDIYMDYLNLGTLED